MRVLRTSQSKITRPLLTRFHTTLLASMCRAMPFSGRALKKKNVFFDVDIVVKTNCNVVYRGLYSVYRQRVRFITLLPNIFHIVSAC